MQHFLKENNPNQKNTGPLKQVTEKETQCFTRSNEKGVEALKKRLSASTR